MNVDPSGNQPSFGCVVGAATCAGSVGFVFDNAALIGFAIDWGACTLAATQCGTDLLLELIENQLGTNAADTLGGILGHGSTRSTGIYTGESCDALPFFFSATGEAIIPINILEEADKVRDRVGEYHITLGLNTADQRLIQFTLYVQDIVDPSFTIPVLPYSDWHQRLGTPEITPSSPNSFALAFPIAAMGAEKIHFNLQGILNSEPYFVSTYDEYIEKYGSDGRFNNLLTADEMYWVKSAFCNKTEFYNTTDGATWQVDPIAKSQICGS